MARFWYRVEVSTATETYFYFGTSDLAEEQLMASTASGAFLLLDDLTYFDEDREARPWTEWDAHYLPRIYLNPDNIVSVMRLVDDPRTMEGEGSKVLRYPGTKDKDDGEDGS